MNNTARVGNQLRLHRVDRQARFGGCGDQCLSLDRDLHWRFIVLQFATKEPGFAKFEPCRCHVPQVPLLLSIRKGSMSSSLVQQALQNLEAHRCSADHLSSSCFWPWQYI